MFEFILERLEKAVGVIASARALLLAEKRIRVGKSLVQFQQSLSRISENAQQLEIAAERIARKELPSSTRIDEIQRLVEVQRHELKILESLFQKNRAFLDVFGDELPQVLGFLIPGKIAVLDEIYSRILNTEDGKIIVIPKDLTLSNLASEFEPGDLVPGGYSLYMFMSSFPKDRVVHCFTVSSLPDPLTPEIRSAFEGFASQMASLRTGQRFQACSDKLAVVLKTHFKIEELF
jgi:hypothetical protein